MVVAKEGRSARRPPPPPPRRCGRPSTRPSAIMTLGRLPAPRRLWERGGAWAVTASGGRGAEGAGGGRSLPGACFCFRAMNTEVINCPRCKRAQAGDDDDECAVAGVDARVPDCRVDRNDSIVPINKARPAERLQLLETTPDFRGRCGLSAVEAAPPHIEHGLDGRGAACRSSKLF